MTKLVFKHIVNFFVLVLLQIFVFNNVYLFSLIHPLPYVYFILMLPVLMNRNLVLVFAFTTGLIVDIFSNTYGMHAASLLFIAFLRYYFLSNILSDDILDQGLSPHFRVLGMNRFLIYLTTFVFIHHLLLHFLQIYTFKDIFYTLFKVFINTIFTSFVILIYELSFFYHEVRKQ